MAQEFGTVVLPAAHEAHFPFGGSSNLARVYTRGAYACSASTYSFAARPGTAP